MALGVLFIHAGSEISSGRLVLEYFAFKDLSQVVARRFGKCSTVGTIVKRLGRLICKSEETQQCRPGGTSTISPAKYNPRYRDMVTVHKQSYGARLRVE